MTEYAREEGAGGPRAGAAAAPAFGRADTGAFRLPTGPQYLVIFGLILVAWAVLFASAVPAELRETSRVFGGEFWAALCTVTLDPAGFGRLALMWTLMAAAMMLPTVLPALATYQDISQAGAKTAPLTLVAGFLTVWAGFALIAAGLQMALYRVDLVSAFGDSRSAVFSAALLGAAGLYQFSAVKESCLQKCRMPMTFFLGHWEEGPWKMGLRLGLVCLGCCWALMALAFVGGVMSLAFMGLGTLLMTLEKLPDIGRWLSKPLGAALIAGGLWVALSGL